MPRAHEVPGHNYTLDETIAMDAGRFVRYWGPYPVTESFYDAAKARTEMLALGQTHYKMFVLSDDHRAPAGRNEPGGAINCIMGVSDLGGYLNTGTAYAVRASVRVLESFARFMIGFTADSHIAGLMRIPQRLGDQASPGFMNKSE
jgi:hypothetical protein